jgi:hypothetical protein
MQPLCARRLNWCEKEIQLGLGADRDSWAAFAFIHLAMQQPELYNYGFAHTALVKPKLVGLRVVNNEHV